EVVPTHFLAGPYEFIQRGTTLDLHGLLVREYVFHQDASVTAYFSIGNLTCLQNTDQKRARDAEHLGSLVGRQLRSLWVENEDLLSRHEGENPGEQSQRSRWNLKARHVAAVSILLDKRNPACLRTIQRLAHQAACLRKQFRILVTQVYPVCCNG